MAADPKIPQDRRIAVRCQTGNLVVHSDVTEKDPQKTLGLCVTLDLNEFGMRIQSSEPIPVGERYRFQIAIHDEIVEALGQVVHVARALNGTFEMGVEFLELTARHIEKLRAFTSERSRKL